LLSTARAAPAAGTFTGADQLWEVCFFSDTYNPKSVELNGFAISPGKNPFVISEGL